MPDEKHRKRIEELIQRELGGVLLTYPKKSILNRITITAVNVAPDLAVARIFFSVFDEVDIEEAKKSLQEETKFLRKSLAYDLNLRLTPKLHFIYDESIKRARRLTDLIDAAIASDENKHHG